MLGRTIDMTLRNLSTLALVCAIVLAPLHLVYGFVNRDAIAVREMSPAIEAFPEGRQVRGVGRAELARERVSRWLLLLAVLSTVPVLLGPTRRVLAADEDGATPTALGALRGRRLDRRARPEPPLVLLGALMALVVIVLVEATAAIVVPMLEDSSEWVGVAAGQTLARSLGLPFLTVALTIGNSSSRRARSLDLY
jgi:hypothetical protein